MSTPATQEPSDLLVLGGGTAGMVGAKTGASLGARVLLVERNRTGGDCLWTGCVSSKPLLAAAAAAAARGGTRFGVHAGPVQVDFAAVMSHVHTAIVTIEPVDCPQALEEAGVTVASGTAVFTGPDRAQIDGRTVAFRSALLATGAANTQLRGVLMTPPIALRWVPVLAGALVLSLLLAPVGPVPFYFTPLVLGLTYTAAAFLGGRGGTLWAPAVIITFWGIAVALEFSHTTHADFTSVAVTALGAGATVAALLGRLGVRTEPLAIGLTVLGAGFFELLASLGVGILGNGWFYGVLLGIWVIADLTSSSPLRRRRQPVA